MYYVGILKILKQVFKILSEDEINLLVLPWCLFSFFSEYDFFW